MQRESNKKSS